jgi:peptidoglycan hydrolase-like protein with peptidoglycan-binding domain
MNVTVTGKGSQDTLNATVTLSAVMNQTHALVKPVQKYLYALGYTEVGTADGEAGPLFTQAVNRYQKEKLGYQDGEITAKEKTWQKLINFTPTKEEPKPVAPAPEEPKEEPKPTPTPEEPKQETETKPATPAPENKPSIPAEPEALKLKIGDTVKLVAGARYANGKTPLSWVYSSKLYIRDFRENESAVISTQKTGPITGVVYLKDLVPYNSVYDIIVTANLLNVRHKPTTNSDIVNQIKKNTRHTIYEEENGWGHILNSGWISLNYARKV